MSKTTTCNTIKGDGYWCTQPVVMVGTDGYGYCKRHAQNYTPGAYPPVGHDPRKMIFAGAAK